ncbi:VOC family protein [Staphylococcus edaphicus]|uniref:Sulfurtransferase n=1 Tax=Staphylococcus edaphicus TaxID=1955013 RepID=A0A2C6WR51_9STAP|nr:VOC family protein [Staphylococcus edaphicus]PHK50226.1 sulfurtransferase [Staphylococcus edaphicus]UQW82176.1 VOC family protein [Staphylococcus edaphicus]
MQYLKLDHIIHYIHHLENFKFPGHLFTLNQGGQHERLGTYNRLAYLENAYLELLDVYKPETLQKIVKTDEGRVSFPSKIVQDHYSQGMKTLALSTTNINQLKEELEGKGIDVIGPVDMHRENIKGDKTAWKLLYIADPDYRVKPPFFIQWEEREQKRDEKLQALRQNEFTIKSIDLHSTERRHTVNKWRHWFDMEVVSEDNKVTILKLNNNDVLFKISDGPNSGYKSVTIKDSKTTSPYTLIIRGLSYKFEAD